MSTRFPRYGLLLLLVSLGVATACEREAVTITEPAASTTPTAKSTFAAEPAAVQPEILPGTECVTLPAFGVRISIVAGGSQGVILRGLRFGFNDRFGGSAFPDVIPIPTISSPIPGQSNIPASMPVPVPGTAPLPGVSTIPMPGSTPLTGLFISPGTSRTLPFFLRFRCGTFAQGILVITADSADANGRFDTTDLRVRVGS